MKPILGYRCGRSTGHNAGDITVDKYYMYIKGLVLMDAQKLMKAAKDRGYEQNVRWYGEKAKKCLDITGDTVYYEEYTGNPELEIVWQVNTDDEVDQAYAPRIELTGMSGINLAAVEMLNRIVNKFKKQEISLSNITPARVVEVIEELKGFQVKYIESFMWVKESHVDKGFVFSSNS